MFPHPYALFTRNSASHFCMGNLRCFACPGAKDEQFRGKSWLLSLFTHLNLCFPPVSEKKSSHSWLLKNFFVALSYFGLPHWKNYFAGYLLLSLSATLDDQILESLAKQDRIPSSSSMKVHLQFSHNYSFERCWIQCVNYPFDVCVPERRCDEFADVRSSQYALGGHTVWK